MSTRPRAICSEKQRGDGETQKRAARPASSSCHRNSGGEVPQDQGLPPRSPRPTCKVGTAPRLGPRPHTVLHRRLLPRGPSARRVTLSVRKNGHRLHAPIPANLRPHAEKSRGKELVAKSHSVHRDREALTRSSEHGGRSACSWGNVRCSGHTRARDAHCQSQRGSRMQAWACCCGWSLSAEQEDY